MSKWTRLRRRLLGGQSDQAIVFAEMVAYLRHLGFSECIRGSHHIFSLDGVPQIVNIQPRPDGSAKPYQIRQVRSILATYRLGDHDN